MRRSVRDAIVGFTVIGGIIGFASTALWLRGVAGSSHWTVTARFSDAAGLAERSPVTYRGILVGSVRSIEVTLRRWWLTISITVVCSAASVIATVVLVRYWAAAQGLPC